MLEKRILLVEDDEDVGELLAVALEDAGYEVDVAKTAPESWAHLAANGYALVIADWRLPDGDGSVIADGAADLLRWGLTGGLARETLRDGRPCDSHGAAGGHRGCRRSGAAAGRDLASGRAP